MKHFVGLARQMGQGIVRYVYSDMFHAQKHIAVALDTIKFL